METFNQYGAIANIHFVRAKFGKSADYVFIAFHEALSANYAVRMDGEFLLGRQLK
jgi:hypothetical protein